MVKLLEQYRPGALLAIFCGIFTMFLGFMAILMYNEQAPPYIVIFLTMIVNFLLHAESYITNKKAGIRQNNVLTMTITEGFALLLLLGCFEDISTENIQSDWKCFIILFAFYLIFNGASLLAIPSKFAFCCGSIAILMALLLYFFGSSWRISSTVLVGINLLVNGFERIIMSLLGGKKAS